MLTAVSLVLEQFLAPLRYSVSICRNNGDVQDCLSSDCFLRAISERDISVMSMVYA